MVKVIIAGGGLVGALEACFLAKRGWDVELYEGRADPRKSNAYAGKSINLALSERGIAALKHVGVAEQVIRDATPMSGRMLHAHNGDLTSQAYGKEGQAILSIDRRDLNERLLTLAETYSNVKTFFGHKLKSANTTSNRCVFITEDGDELVVTGDMLIGCDGAHSACRRSLLRYSRIDFNQKYLPHGYKELCIPPNDDGTHRMDPNHLHIWPRKTFMMIALANKDGSFTVTLFMPFTNFEAISTKSELFDFFEKEFPDAIPIIGAQRLEHDFFANPTGSLLTVKCSKIGSATTCLMGDAAHAIVPFYGQGMNAGFEDCSVLEECLNKCNDDIRAAVKAYSDIRTDDVHAIADLALYNYIEMRDLVTSPTFLLRKKVDSVLHAILPRAYIPLYTMVTFTRIPYATVIARNKRQRKIVDTAMVATALGVGAAALVLAKKYKVF